MVGGATLLQLDTWVCQTMWLGLAGAALMVYSMYLGITGKEN
jgi:hypothetical protein